MPYRNHYNASGGQKWFQVFRLACTLATSMQLMRLRNHTNTRTTCAIILKFERSKDGFMSPLRSSAVTTFNCDTA